MEKNRAGAPPSRLDTPLQRSHIMQGSEKVYNTQTATFSPEKLQGAVFSVAFSFIATILHPKVKNKMRRGATPLRSMTTKQIEILVLIWSISKIGKNCIHVKELAKILRYRNLHRVYDDLSPLKTAGLIQYPDPLEMFKMTGKYKKDTKGYYQLTRTGEQAILNYFEEWAKELKSITGNFWADDLEKLANLESGEHTQPYKNIK
jgi:hypothetical protein